MAAPARKRRRGSKYSDDPARELLEVIANGDAVVLNRVLQEMSSIERACVLKAATVNSHSLGCARGDTALHYAVSLDYCSCDVLNCLIENGADVNVRKEYSKRTPLMIAAHCKNLNAVEFLLKHGAIVDVQDKRNKSSLHYGVEGALLSGDTSFDVVSCLLNHGADINAPMNGKYTALMMACRSQHVRLVKFLLQQGANVQVKDKDGKTALHFACELILTWKPASCDLLNCLTENGADINALRKDNRTPLMVASSCGGVDQITFLIKRGANVHLQDKNGDTALHHAARNMNNSLEIVCALTAAGASQMCNNQGLTPLLVASSTGNNAAVEELLKNQEVTKEQRIDALELLGATMVSSDFYDIFLSEGFSYLMRGMEERFADPLHPLLKQPMKPIDAYQNRQESQSLEELVEIGESRNALKMESLIIIERVLGENNSELLNHIRGAAKYFKNNDRSTCIGLYKHAFKTAQICNQSAVEDIYSLSENLNICYENKLLSDQQNQAYVVELLEAIIYEYERISNLSKRKKKGKFFQADLDTLLMCSVKAVSLISSSHHFEVDKASTVLVLTRRLCALNPRDLQGRSLLHEAVKRCQQNSLLLVKNLLHGGLNVNATDHQGNTPLHVAVLLNPCHDMIHLVTNLCEILLNGGAHQDFVNHDGKTAMDLAKTDEVRSFLQEKRKLELKCISARAVKRFELPYLGVVPKILEKFISMH